MSKRVDPPAVAPLTAATFIQHLLDEDWQSRHELSEENLRAVRRFLALFRSHLERGASRESAEDARDHLAQCLQRRSAGLWLNFLARYAQLGGVTPAHGRQVLAEIFVAAMNGRDGDQVAALTRKLLFGSEAGVISGLSGAAPGIVPVAAQLLPWCASALASLAREARAFRAANPDVDLSEMLTIFIDHGARCRSVEERLSEFADRGEAFERALGDLPLLTDSIVERMKTGTALLGRMSLLQPSEVDLGALFEALLGALRKVSPAAPIDTLLGADAEGMVTLLRDLHRCAAPDMVAVYERLFALAGSVEMLAGPQRTREELVAFRLVYLDVVTHGAEAVIRGLVEQLLNAFPIGARGRPKLAEHAREAITEILRSFIPECFLPERRRLVPVHRAMLQVVERWAAVSPDLALLSDPSMRLTLQIADAALGEHPVFIVGETGTGKDVTAKAIHQLSARKAKKFNAVNIGGLPETLAISILFGHKKGSFTGALKDHKGAFKEADGGTLFLDEMGDASPHVQTLLLRALSSKKIRPLGSENEEVVDVRIIVATSRPVDADESTPLRKDLLFRLRYDWALHLPALRERSREDIVGLWHKLVERAACEQDCTIATPPLREQEKDVLTALPWPGNVREMEGLADEYVRRNRYAHYPMSVAEFLIHCAEMEGVEADTTLNWPNDRALDQAAAALRASGDRKRFMADFEQRLIEHLIRRGGDVEAARIWGVAGGSLGKQLRRLRPKTSGKPQRKRG